MSHIIRFLNHQLSVYSQSHEQATLQSAWGLDLFSSAFQSCPQRADRPPNSSNLSDLLRPQEGFISTLLLQGIPPRPLGCKCELPIISPSFPRKSGWESSMPPDGSDFLPASSYPLLTLSNFLTGKSQLLFTFQFTCWQSGVQERGEKWRDWGTKRLLEALPGRQKSGDCFLFLFLFFPLPILAS